MKRSLVVMVALAAVFAATAAAKGPSNVRITGPGLASPIVLRGSPEENLGSRFGRLVETSGWFSQVFRRSPDPTSRTRPPGRLGPRFVAVYVVPQGDGGPATIRQELYPYASAGPVSHMLAGQPVMGQESWGGWYRGGVTLGRTLAALGLPVRPPG